MSSLIKLGSSLVLLFFCISLLNVIGCGNPIANDDFYVIDRPQDVNPAENDSDIQYGFWPGDGLYTWVDPCDPGQAAGCVHLTNSPTFTGFDHFTYCWGHLDPTQSYLVCESREATVWLVEIGDDDSQNLGSCRMHRRIPTAPSNVGGPVNVTNGNMWLEQPDYSLPGIGETINVSRFYNSARQVSGLFGFGWTTKYDESLTLYDDRMLKLSLPDAKGIFFARPYTSGNEFQSVSVDLTARIIKNQDNTYTLNFQDGRVHKFDSNGRLLWQRDRNGNQTTLTYNTNNVLTSVTDPVGRTLTFTPGINGKISQISDSTGIVASYEYDLSGLLLKTVTYEDGSKYKFEYTNIVVNGQTKTYLTTVTDALNNVLETHQYDSQGRAITSEKQGGVDKYIIEFTADSLRTILTLPIQWGA